MLLTRCSISFILLLLIIAAGAAPPDTARLTRTLSVAQGLPQSFTSGLVQDAQGFIWISTRDGLARYDGRQFKIFNRTPGDTNTLADNIIANLHYDQSGWLWIMYESGKLDRLHTATEKLQHLSSQPFCAGFTEALQKHSGWLSFAEDDAGNVWLLVEKWGIYVFNMAQNRLQFYDSATLYTAGNPLLGIAKWGKEMLLVYNTGFVMMDMPGHISRVIPFRFPHPCIDSTLKPQHITPMVRKNGEVILLDTRQIIVYHPASQNFITVPLPQEKSRSTNQSIALGQDDCLFFDQGSNIYRFFANNTLQLWSSNTGRFNQSICMLQDRSGMLWVGGNASPIRLYDRRLTHLQEKFYSTSKENFIDVVLNKYAHIDPVQLAKAFKHRPLNFGLRWAKNNSGATWVAAFSEELFTRYTYLLQNDHLQETAWQVTGAAKDKAALHNISALAFSTTGRLWGIDYQSHPVLFDTITYTATVYPAIAAVAEGVKSMMVDGDSVFWMSSASNGLLRYSRNTSSLQQYNTGSNSVANFNTSILQPDPVDASKLWIGTMGDGLLHFDKKTGQSKIYSTANGLPNNTVYTILPDALGRIWGSTNLGLFRLNPKTGSVYHFASRNGLLGDEFNRFQFFSLPDGQMVFGGIDGYVVFDPLLVAIDTFKPAVVLTSISINNERADYGYSHSPLAAAVNSLSILQLPYTSNILSFEFAALEYNMPEKLNYRYRLEGFDEAWIDARTNNMAVYTNLSPGHYTLKVEATNTSGEWSPYQKQLAIVIHPPFWKTTWFILLCIAVAISLSWWAIQSRIASIKNKARKQLEFERKAMELEAAALRAQMNPHFVFNCLNSIKSLIHEDKKREAVLYLTTFSKLIRSQLTSAQKEISLHEELETCRLYTQLEALRFGSKISVHFKVAEGVDLHSVMVPPLIIQPFIENAIWHGILPKEEGGVITVEVKTEADGISCTIDDNGIGRATSQLNKSKTNPTHHSKGMQLTQERLHLHSRIYNRGGRLEIIDKADTAKTATGTRVILHFQTGSNE